MASLPDTNSDIKEVDVSNEYEVEVKEVTESDKEFILPKEAPLKSSAAKVKIAATKKKAELTKISGKTTLLGPANLNKKPRISAAAKKERKMPEVFSIFNVLLLTLHCELINSKCRNKLASPIFHQFAVYVNLKKNLLLYPRRKPLLLE
jgi:hypothetical protein